MTQNQLLVAVDRSEAGQAAVDFTIGFAARSRARVTVLHVRELPSSLRVPPLESADEARALVQESVARINEAGIPAEGMIYTTREPNVAKCIVETADECGCGAIVLGSHRLRGIRRLAGRKVREQAMRLSILPVVVAPPALLPTTPSWHSGPNHVGAA